jgi:Ca2+-binding EF-hand superfamily protein
LLENDRKQFSIKDVQMMMQFYDLNGGGYLSYNEFLKFILPCDDEELREAACQRKTYEVDVAKGKKLHPTVEKAMADYF